MRRLKIQYAILPIKFKFINKFVFILPVKQPAQQFLLTLRSFI